jgi:hypothetical protein
VARPRKVGIDYFPVVVHFDDKVMQLQSRFGFFGVGVLVALWQRIYGDKGYFTPWDDMTAKVFSVPRGARADEVQQVVLACLEIGVFDRGLYERYGVLSSAGIQKQYVEITKNRKGLELNPDYLLVALPANDDFTPKTVHKVNEIKIPNGIESKTTYGSKKEKPTPDGAAPLSPSPADVVVCGAVEVKKTEYDVMVLAWGKDAVDAKMARMNDWLTQHPDRSIKDQCAKLRNWLAADEAERASALPLARPGKTVRAQRVPQRQYSDEEYGALYADLDKVLKEE